MALQQIEFQSTNGRIFSQWLKKYSLIDSTLLLELDEKNQKFLAKAYDEARSVVKYSEISFADINFSYKKSKEPKRIKIGIYNISTLIKIIDMFSNSEFNFIVYFDEIIGTEETDLAATKIKIANKSLKMDIDCTSLNIFKYISDTLFQNTISKVETYIEYDLTKELIEKINSLSKLDSDNNFLKFIVENDNLYVKGKSFELLLENANITSQNELDINKEQFEKIDVENYNIIIGEDRLVFKSKENNTITVVSAVEKNEYDSEK